MDALLLTLTMTVDATKDPAYEPYVYVNLPFELQYINFSSTSAVSDMELSHHVKCYVQMQ